MSKHVDYTSNRGVRITVGGRELPSVERRDNYRVFGIPFVAGDHGFTGEEEVRVDFPDGAYKLLGPLNTIAKKVDGKNWLIDDRARTIMDGAPLQYPDGDPRSKLQPWVANGQEQEQWWYKGIAGSCARALDNQAQLAKFVTSPVALRIQTEVFEDSMRAHGIATKVDQQFVASFLRISHVAQAALEHGETYYWAPDMCDLIATVADTLPDCTLTRDLLPAPMGYCYFSTPIPLPNGPGLRGVSWIMVREDPAAAARQGVMSSANNPALIAVTDPKSPDQQRATGIFVHFYTEDRLIREGGVPQGNTSWQFGEALSDIGQQSLDRLDRWVGKHIEAGQPARNVHAAIVDLAGAVERGPKETGMLHVADVPRFEAKLKLFAAAMLFMKQDILRASPEHVDRATERRTRKDNTIKRDNLAEVLVVQLRRIKYTGARADEHNERDWQCQWIVSGHWRNQAYGPNYEYRRPTWIEPYRKGPEGKPMRISGTKVYAVTR